VKAQKAQKSTLTHLADGRYELVSILGEGGMAAVWRARDHQAGGEIAVKILHAEIAERRSYRSRFLAEARTMQRMRHPSVLRVWDLGEDEGRPWFTMEIVDDGALIDRLERTGRVPPLEALDITFQTLQALQVAHLATVVHRDVKPDNILLNKDGSVRLSDFGIARIRNERVDHQTRTGVAMGTVGYMSPEQRESARDVGPGADIYAIGATLYATVTGCEPPDLFAAHLDPKLLDAVPPAIRDVVRTATAYRPENRYASARAMAEDIAKARDAVARGLGQPEVAAQWLARFDALIIESQAARAELEPPKAPSEEELPAEKGDGRAGTPPPGAMSLDRHARPGLPTPAAAKSAQDAASMDAVEAPPHLPWVVIAAVAVVVVLVVGVASVLTFGQ
jgi:serine/threonine protein kinase